MTTKADLRRMILSHLTVIDETESPNADQSSLLDLWIDNARAMLLEVGLCWWDDDAIPASVTIPLVMYVAGLCCGSFGRAGKVYEAGAGSGRRQIAALKSSEVREEQRAVYF